MKTFEYDFRYLQSGLEVMVNYLLSSDTFWPLDVHPSEGEPDYPQLTLGGLLLSRARLIGYQKSPAQMDQVTELFAEMDRIHAKWRVAWEKKAGHSFSVRIRMWRDFIEEYRNAPQDNADRYPYEVRLRTMLSLLKSEGGGQLPAEEDLLTVLDGYIKTVFSTDGFIWESEVQAGFPKDVYWYLYGKLLTVAR